MRGQRARRLCQPALVCRSGAGADLELCRARTARAGAARWPRTGSSGLLDALVGAARGAARRRSRGRATRWTRRSSARCSAGIVGFEMEVRAWRPTFKLSQNKTAEDRAAVAEALEAQGSPAHGRADAEPGPNDHAPRRVRLRRHAGRRAGGGLRGDGTGFRRVRPASHRRATQVRRIVGLSLPVAMRRLAPERPPRRHARLVDAYSRRSSARAREGRVAEPLYDGIDPLLRRAARRGLAARRRHRQVRPRADRTASRRTDLADLFVHPADRRPPPVQAAPGDARGGHGAKPGPTPADTVMIGDTTFDIEMARAAGCRALGVAWGYHAPRRTAGRRRRGGRRDRRRTGGDARWLADPRTTARPRQHSAGW